MSSRVLEIKLWIKDKRSQRIVELSKRENFGVRWKGSVGEIKKWVIFNKDYRVLVGILLRKYLLGTREVVEKRKFLVPLNVPYEIYQGYMGEPNNSPEKDEERQEIVKLTNHWRVGRIVFFLLIVVFIVFILILVWKRQRQNN